MCSLCQSGEQVAMQLAVKFRNPSGLATENFLLFFKGEVPWRVVETEVINNTVLCD